MPGNLSQKEFVSIETWPIVRLSLFSGPLIRRFRPYGLPIWSDSTYEFVLEL